MAKRHDGKLARQGSPKARINATKNRKGYRVFQSSKYLGFFRTKKEAEKCVRIMTFPDQQHVKREPPKPYKYVASKSTKKKTVYYGVMRVRTKGQWTKKYFPWCESPETAAEMVAEYLQTTAGSIKANKSQRESPAQSAERMAFLSKVFRGWIPADLENAVSYRGQASSLQACGPAAYVAGLLGKEDQWRGAVLKVWDAMPLAERSKLHGLGSRDQSMVRHGARALHDLLSLSFAMWGRWSIPRLTSMPWPVNVRKEVAPNPRTASCR